MLVPAIILQITLLVSAKQDGFADIVFRVLTYKLTDAIIHTKNISHR